MAFFSLTMIMLSRHVYFNNRVEKGKSVGLNGDTLLPLLFPRDVGRDARRVQFPWQLAKVRIRSKSYRIRDRPPDKVSVISVKFALDWERDDRRGGKFEFAKADRISQLFH